MDLTKALRAAIDQKTKPQGSLGQIETLAAQLATIQGSLKPQVASCELLLFAADHGIAESGVSAFPQKVTRQMVLNILAGGAASSVFANSVGVSIKVIDAGVQPPRVENLALIDRWIGPGTRNSLLEPAMTSGQFAEALAAGQQLGMNVDSDVCALGELGIGNTAAASLVTAKVLGIPVADIAGRGTGLSDEGLRRKIICLEQAAHRTAPILSVEEALQHYGGFEIVMLAGAMLGAEANARPIIVDGFICSVAALCATRLHPDCRSSLIFSHKSTERGHLSVIRALNAQPLLDLQLRLGEGTGALLAWPLLRAAADMLNNMASFDSAGVSERL